MEVEAILDLLIGSHSFRTLQEGAAHIGPAVAVPTPAAPARAGHRRPAAATSGSPGRSAQQRSQRAGGPSSQGQHTKPRQHPSQHPRAAGPAPGQDDESNPDACAQSASPGYWAAARAAVHIRAGRGQPVRTAWLFFVAHWKMENTILDSSTDFNLNFNSFQWSNSFRLELQTEITVAASEGCLLLEPQCTVSSPALRGV